MLVPCFCLQINQIISDLETNYNFRNEEYKISNKNATSSIPQKDSVFHQIIIKIFFSTTVLSEKGNFLWLGTTEVR